MAGICASQLITRKGIGREKAAPMLLALHFSNRYKLGKFMINRNLAFCIGIFLIFSHKVIAEPLSHKNLGLIYTEAKSDDLDASGYGLEAEILIWDHLILGGYLASAKNKSGLEGVNSVNSRFIGIVASIVTSISESTEVYGGMDLSRVKTESETGYSSLSGSVIHKDFFVGLGFSTHSA